MLIDNTLFLREYYPEVRNNIQEYEKDINTNRITVLESKAGIKTIQYETDEQRQLMVHSKYDPIKEADRIISSHKEKITDDTHVFFYGIGMGYHVEKFQELFPKHSYSLYEPVPEIFLTLAEQRTLNSIITKNISNLYIDTHETESNGYLQEFNSSNQSIHFIILPSYENIIKEKIDRFNEKIKNVIQSRRTALGTNMSFQRLWVANSLINFKEVLNTPNMFRDIDSNHFAGKPAIIVAAGPSLAEDIEHLRYIKENNLAYLFSVGSAINSLIEYDVLPDAVCTYDPGVKNHLVFKKMVEKDINHIPMLFGTSVGFETLRNYEGPKVHFITSQDKTSTYFLDEQLDVTQDLIMDSPSIAVMTFQVLNKIGAGPIIFAGQNLGYLHDRRYSEGIEYDFIKSEVSENEMEKAITTTDVYGNEIKTNVSFNNMRLGIEHYAKLYAGNYINTTKGGAVIDGIPFQSIEEVIENVLIQPIEKTAWWNEINSYNKSKFIHQEEHLKQSIHKFKDLVAQFKTLIKSMASTVELRNKTSMESLFVQFDKLYGEINQNTYYANFLSFIFVYMWNLW
ncbi:DUF115 domain-containing protein [Oceanobacillus sp. 143]|nr:DUF115 domain-containing protein [Oceanobacillus sp. 143]